MSTITIDESPADARHRLTRRLGIYLFVIAWHQIVFYLIWSSDSSPDWLYLFDPRAGALLVGSVVLDLDLNGPGVLSWAFALILLLVASIVLITRRGLKLYLAVESLLSVPTIFAGAWILITRIGSPEGFPILQLIPPLVVFLVFSALPYGTAVRVLAASPVDLSILPRTGNEAGTARTQVSQTDFAAK